MDAKNPRRPRPDVSPKSPRRGAFESSAAPLRTHRNECLRFKSAACPAAPGVVAAKASPGNSPRVWVRAGAAVGAEVGAAEAEACADKADADLYDAQGLGLTGVLEKKGAAVWSKKTFVWRPGSKEVAYFASMAEHKAGKVRASSLPLPAP